MINYDNLSHDEQFAILEQAVNALNEGDIEKSDKISSVIPIEPVTAKVFTLVYGENYIKEHGYRVRETKK